MEIGYVFVVVVSLAIGFSMGFVFAAVLHVGGTS